MVINTLLFFYECWAVQSMHSWKNTKDLFNSLTFKLDINKRCRIFMVMISTVYGTQPVFKDWTCLSRWHLVALLSNWAKGAMNLVEYLLCMKIVFSSWSFQTRKSRFLISDIWFLISDSWFLIIQPIVLHK